MAKTAKGKPAFASLNPDDMIQGGLPSDFRGVVTEAAFVKFDYDGNVEEPVLAARLTITPAEGEDVEEPIVQHWSAGDLKNFVPASEDGEEVDEGQYAMRVGKKAEMSKSSNYAQLMATVLDCGTAAKGKPFTSKNLTGAITDLVGLDAQWDRVPQKKRSGMVDLEEEGGEEKKKGRDLLVVTEVFGYDPDGAADAKPAKKKSAKPVVEEDEDEVEEDEEEETPKKKPAKKPTKPAKDEDDEESEDEEQEEESDDESSDDDEDASPLDADLAKAIKKGIVTAGGTLKRGKLSALVLKAFATDKRKAKMVERATEDDFLSGKGRPWEYDDETGVLSIE